MMQIEKGSRHRHITGKFGEWLVCHWLSRSGFEVAVADHTGLDLVAYNRKTEQRLGITVKSRLREKGKESKSVNILSKRKKGTDREKLKDACKWFNCKPWIAVYVETKDYADLYLTSLDNYEKYRTKDKELAVETWKMSSKQKELYGQDEAVKHIHAKFTPDAWPESSVEWAA